MISSTIDYQTKAPRRHDHIDITITRLIKIVIFLIFQVVRGDIDPSFNVVEITPEARAELEKIENKIGDYVCQLCKELFQNLSHIRDTGIGVLMVEQNARAALRMSDRAYVLAEGANKLDGQAADLLNDPEVGEIFLGGAPKGVS